MTNIFQRGRSTTNQYIIIQYIYTYYIYMYVHLNIALWWILFPNFVAIRSAISTIESLEILPFFSHKTSEWFQIQLDPKSWKNPTNKYSILCFVHVYICLLNPHFALKTEAHFPFTLLWTLGLNSRGEETSQVPR